MLTKWGAALGLASAGRVVAGGGGGPLGDATVWPAVLDWTALGTIAGPLRVGDFAPVNDLQPGSGLAIYDGTDWRLYQAVFPTVADLLAFGQLKLVGAFAVVGTGVETDPAYYYTGSAWKRMADTVPFAWTLSSLRDFSAVGLQDGDYGVLTPSGGQPILLRYKAACTFGAGTVQAWMTPIAYAGTPVMQAWTDGTESNATLATQGWTIVNDVGCSVTATGGFQRLESAATATAARLRCMVGTVAAATRFETIFEARASTGGNSTLANPFVVIDGTNGSVFGQCGSTGLGFRDFLFGGPLQTPLRNNAGVSLPTLVQTAATCLVRDEGRTVLSSSFRDGLPLGDYRRNLQTNAANLVQVAAQGQSGTAGTLDYRGQIITY